MAKVIARIKGGLGNQLFCYAAARRLAMINDAELVIDDITGFKRDHIYSRKFNLDKFNITARRATAFERKEPFERYRRGIVKFIAGRKPFSQRTYLEQYGTDFDPRLLDFRVKGTVYLDGLWQDERYFKDIENTIRHDLSITPPEDSINQMMAKRITECNAVGVHVRWFDKPEEISKNKGKNMKSEYYCSAVEEIRAKLTEPHFFLFSDYPEAALSLLPLPDKAITSVSHNGQDKAYADLFLMCRCKHFIIANSTFSWWGAWLGKAESKIVIAPETRIIGSHCEQGGLT